MGNSDGDRGPKAQSRSHTMDGERALVMFVCMLISTAYQTPHAFPHHFLGHTKDALKTVQ